MKDIFWTEVQPVLPGLLVTNHDEAQAVVLSIDAYRAMHDVYRQSETGSDLALDSLRRR